MLLAILLTAFLASLADRGSSTQLLFICVPVSMILIVGILLYFIFFISRSLWRLRQAADALRHHEIESLTLAISELARGNLSIRTDDIHTKTSTSVQDERMIPSEIIQPLIHMHRNIARLARESLLEINQVTASPCRPGFL